MHITSLCTCAAHVRISQKLLFRENPMCHEMFTTQKFPGIIMVYVILHNAVQVYFVDYLRRCLSYGLTKDNPPPPSVPPLDSAPSGPTPSGPAERGTTGSQRRSYEQLASERAVKIQRLRERKELERRTEELTAALNRGGRGWGEGEGEEEGREAWVSLLQLHVCRSQEFVKSIKEEVLILRHMESVRKGEVPVAKKQGGASGSGPAQALSGQPMKPLVITREMLRVS